MKVGILTFHRAINYGAALQAYALYHTLRRIGVDPYIIDYISPSVSSLHHKINPSLNPRKLLRYLRFGKSVNKRFDRFNEFIESMESTEKAFDSEGITKIGECLDAVICGSDQVWNLKITGNDYNYFLASIPVSTKKIAYAASFGLSEYPKEQKEELKRVLNRFDAISVRERVGQEIVRSLIGKTPSLVLDPTLLLRKKEWEELSEPIAMEGPYLLIYSVGQIEDLFPAALEISKRLGYRIAIISHQKFSSLPGAIYFKDLSPLQFVGLVSKAQVVVTNSFHGTAFSVVLEKRFIIVPRSETKNPGLNSRMETLLEKTGLETQMLRGQDVDLVSLIDADHRAAAQKLERLRKESIEFLRNSLHQ